MGRDDQTGLPNQLIPCPLGARNASDSCKKSRCEYVIIPLSISPILPTTQIDLYNSIWINIFCLIFLVIILKYLTYFFKPNIIKK